MVSSLVAVLVVDRLEPIDLKGNDDEIVGSSGRALAQLSGAVGETLAVIQTGDRIRGRKQRGAALLLRPQFRFMLQVDIAAPAEQDECDIERQSRAGEANIGS